MSGSTGGTRTADKAEPIPVGVEDPDAYRRARRMYIAGTARGFRKAVCDTMSSRYCVYHWTMSLALCLEAVALGFLAVWPVWCGTILFCVALAACCCVNPAIAAAAYRRYWCLQRRAFGFKG